MGIQFKCKCGKSFTVKEDLAGKKAKCPSCSSILRIPPCPPPALPLSLPADSPVSGEVPNAPRLAKRTRGAISKQPGFLTRAAQWIAGNSALHNAVVGGNESLVRATLTREGLERTNRSGQTPLHLAIKHGYSDIVRMLIAEFAADLESVDANTTTPLSLAAEAGHAEIVQFLLERGAKPTAVDKLGRTPMHLAAGKGHADVLKVFCEAGCDVNVPGEFSKRSPLALAAVSGNVEAVAI